MEIKTVVVTVNYNKPDLTKKCLKSLSTSSRPVQTVVVDNASDEGDIGAACLEFNNVTLLRSPENIGFGRANNMGMRWAIENTNCEYLFLLNNDAYVNEDTIPVLERYMDANAHIDGCSSRIVFSDTPDVLWYGGGELNWKIGWGRSWDYLKKFNGDLSPAEGTFITGCSMMLRTGIIRKVGGFDPRFFMYAEDIELCARIIGSGGRLAYVPSAIVWHDAHTSLRETNQEFIVYESIENKYLDFYLENAICNHLLTLNYHARGLDRFLGNCYLFAKWGRIATIHLIKGRPSTIIFILKGIFIFINKRKLPFVNELLDPKEPQDE